MLKEPRQCEAEKLHTQYHLEQEFAMTTIFLEAPVPIMQKTPKTNQCKWIVYMLRCADDSLYTGVTTNLPRRLHEHNFSTSGARYTRSRRPVRLVHAEMAMNRSAACRREYQLKKLSRAAKEKLLHKRAEPFSSPAGKVTA